MKNKRIIISVLLVCIVGLLGGLVACTPKTHSGTAYSLVHNGLYVGMANIVINSQGAITEVQLDEACFPDHVVAKADAAESDIVVSGAKSFYKTVKYNNVTMTYDSVQGSYVVGGVTLKEYFKDTAKAEEYYKAVESNNIIVMIGDTENKDIITADGLLKSKNNYWSKEQYPTMKGWIANRDAVVSYVKANGVGSKSFTLDSATKTYKDANGVDTGASFADLADKEGNTAYVSYMALMKLAFDAVK